MQCCCSVVGVAQPSDKLAQPAAGVSSSHLLQQQIYWLTMLESNLSIRFYRTDKLEQTVFFYIQFKAVIIN
ncbi:hypothetical protein H6G97_07000 [Nostoc flagelliforme FACHB-838]|uniref:Uncharacterized protein n=1 Tax=Nostoc flagelliforme FACHB-838 TaxID=2692904 RepID=A0ABR8DKT4_9NOSO|nr:hypothetical protein [Nostoc flagelliforme FACHB-838]